MVSTFTVLAASMMLGQTPDAPAVIGPVPAPRTYTYSGGILVPVNEAQKPALPPDDDTERRPILSKIRSWFKRSDDAPPHTFGGNDAKSSVKPMAPAAEFVVPSSDMPRKLPTTQSFAPRSEVQVIQQKGTLEAPKSDQPKTEVVSNVSLKPAPAAASPILPANADRIGRDEKFEWVTGQLAIEKGHFILYYATPETVDTHHGRIQLNPQKVDMRQFHNGDLISVHGRLSGGTTPTYNLTTADLIERAKR